jgi:hypothetical protein
MKIAERPITEEAISSSSHIEQGMLILLALCVFGCFAFPEVIITKFSIQLPTFSNRLPYATPFLIALLWVVASYGSKREGGRIRIELPEILFVLNVVVIIAIEVLHYHRLGSNPMDSADFLLPLFWVFCFYYVFRECSRLGRHADFLYWLCLLVPTVICVLQLLMYLEIVPGAAVPLKHIMRGDRPEGSHLNYSSYVALSGIWVILFSGWRPYGAGSNEIKISLLFIFFTLMIMVNQTRGALLIAGILVGLKLCAYLSIGVRRVIYILCSGIVICLIGYIVVHFDPEPFVRNIQDDSARQRLMAIFLFHNQLDKSYIFGVGNFKDINFEGLQPHTYFVRVLLSYGLMGLLFFMLLILSMFYARDVSRGISALSGLILMLGCMLFEGDLYWWYAVIPVLTLLSADHQSNVEEARLM